MAKALIFIALVCFGATTFSAEINGIRVWPAPDKTRVVFDLDNRVDFQLFELPSPNRLVIDFKNSRAVRRIIPKVSKNKLLKGIRTASKGSSIYRVVMDLRSKAYTDIFHLKPNGKKGHRLVVDLTDKPKTVGSNSKATNPAAEKSLQPETIFRDLIVAVDAGHGGKDPGAIGKKGTREKDVVLSIARKLAKKINSTPGMRAILTRNSDVFLELSGRKDIARANNADLFISIHADAFRNHTVRGSSVYILSEKGASSEAARMLAERENAADHIGGVKLNQKNKLLTQVLIDLSQNAVMDASYNVARKVLLGLRTIGPVHKPSVQHAGFVVLKSPDIPSILIETAFISNPKEELKLINPLEQKKLVNAIHKGVINYFSEYAPPDTSLAVR